MNRRVLDGVSKVYEAALTVACKEIVARDYAECPKRAADWSGCRRKNDSHCDAPAQVDCWRRFCLEKGKEG